MGAEAKLGLYISSQSEGYLRSLGAGNGLLLNPEGNNAISAQGIEEVSRPPTADEISRRLILKAAIGGFVTGMGLIALRSDNIPLQPVKPKFVRSREGLPRPIPVHEMPLHKDRVQEV